MMTFQQFLDKDAPETVEVPETPVEQPVEQPVTETPEPVAETSPENE